MMSPDYKAHQAPENGNTGKQRIPCPLHGCKRVYSEVSALETHIKDHEIPAQSIPGKVLKCSTVGCSVSFPDMQKLMEHMRHHHKLNMFFQCESCRTKLRSYRGLLTHLHSCSKVPRGKLKSFEQAPPNQSAASTDPTPMNQQPPQPDAAPQQVVAQLPLQNATSYSQPTVLSVLSPSGFAIPETSPPQLTDVAPLPSVTNITSSQIPLLEPPKSTMVSPEVQAPTETMSPEPIHTSPVSSPQSPPASAAVWKKSQGVTCNRRILWEHTRGRYTCVQCGHVVSNRKEMSKHISSHHSGNQTEETGNAATVV